MTLTFYLHVNYVHVLWEHSLISLFAMTLLLVPSCVMSATSVSTHSLLPEGGSHSAQTTTQNSQADVASYSLDHKMLRLSSSACEDLPLVLCGCLCRVWPSLRQEGVGADRCGWHDTAGNQRESHGKEREDQRIFSKYVHTIHVKIEKNVVFSQVLLLESFGRGLMVCKFYCRKLFFWAILK